MQEKLVVPSYIEAGKQPRNEPGVFAIQAENLVRRFGDVEALARISINIQKGEFFSLLGPSGCGKTTLLRLIAGLDLPDEGSLKISGQDVTHVPAHQRPVNTVFQSYALFPHMSVMDNVAFGLRMKKLPARQIADRVSRIMDVVQIREFAERRPAQLSGGQKQRVALARALVNEPEVLLLDEPLGALDLKLRRQLQTELHQLQRRLGITFIFVTHDQEEALAMSDRIAVMNHGRIEQLGMVEEIYEHPSTRFVAQFLGSCNLLEGPVTAIVGHIATIETQIGRLLVNTTSAPHKLQSGQKASCAIRPEKIILDQPAGPGESNFFQAQIDDLVYSGAETQYRLRIGHQLLNVCTLNSLANHQRFHIGQILNVQLPVDALIVLKD